MYSVLLLRIYVFDTDMNLSLEYKDNDLWSKNL